MIHGGHLYGRHRGCAGSPRPTTRRELLTAASSGLDVWGTGSYAQLMVETCKGTPPNTLAMFAERVP